MRPAHDTDEDAPMARIARLVAAIKAERETGAEVSADSGERDRLLALLRQLSALRAEERRESQDALQALKHELDDTRAAAQAAQVRHEQAAAQQRQAMADLELLHEHQRSIWQLDRRRLEITIAGHEQTRPARSSRVAIVAAVVAVCVAGLVLVGDRYVAGPASDAVAHVPYAPASGSSR
jgi:hypothetical protein